MVLLEPELEHRVRRQILKTADIDGFPDCIHNECTLSDSGKIVNNTGPEDKVITDDDLIDLNQYLTAGKMRKRINDIAPTTSE